MKIPEIDLYDILNTLIKFVGYDLNQYANHKDTFLYSIFEEQKLDKFSFFKEGRQLLVGQSGRQLKVNIGYNLERAALPTIHIIMPSEMGGKIDGIGFDAGYVEDKVSEGGFERSILTRSFNSNYNLLITSDNMGEVLFIYHLLQAIFIGGYEQLELNGFKLPKTSGQDVTLQQDLIPYAIYHRIMALQIDYEVEVPSLVSRLQNAIHDVKFIGTLSE